MNADVVRCDGFSDGGDERLDAEIHARICRCGVVDRLLRGGRDAVVEWLWQEVEGVSVWNVACGGHRAAVEGWSRGV